jgi:mono/diheme cytochrome c family protein
MLENQKLFVHSSQLRTLLNHQVAKSEVTSSSQKVWAIAVTVVLAILISVAIAYQFQISDPYTKTVLSLSGDPIRGHAIFQMNCAGCHGSRRGTQVGPSLTDVSQRKSRVGLIEQVTSGKPPPMPQFQPSPQAMADLLSYLESL